MPDDIGALNYDPSQGLPPQAPSPAQTFADQQDVAPAQTAQDALRQSAFGDKGASQYQALVAAGQPPAAPMPTGPAALAGGTPPASPIVPPGSNPTSPVANALIAFGGGDPMKSDMERARLEQERQSVAMQQAQFVQTAAKDDFAFLEKLKTIPVQYRPGMIQQYFGSQGRVVPPAMAAMISDQQVLNRMTGGDIESRIANDPSFAQMYWNALDKPKEFLTLHDDVQRSHAEAQKQIADAERAAIQARNEPARSAADVAMHLRQAQRPPTLEEGQALKAAGMAAWTVPMPGAPGHMMWTTGPLSAAPRGANIYDPDKVAKEKAAAAGEATAARTAAGPIPGTITDKLANFDNALDIIGELKKLYAKGGPTDQERQSWLNRVAQEFKYTWGFDQPQNLDEDTALRSLGAITAGRAFVQGRPNQQLMDEIWKHTGQNPLVSPDQMRDRLNIMEHAVTTQKQRTIAYAKSGRGDLEATGAEVNPPPPPPNTISAADFLAQ